MATLIQAARLDRDWSQGRLLRELERSAGTQGITLMSSASLRTAISRWENGHVAPTPPYRGLLCQLLGLAEEDLIRPQLLAPARDDEAEDLRRRITHSARLDAETIDLLRRETEQLRRADRELGATLLSDQMRSHLSRLKESLCASISHAKRRPLAAELADAASLAGWQALDLGHIRAAWTLHETAALAATEADDPSLAAHARGQQAFALLDIAEPQMALSLLSETIQDATGVPPRMSSWLYAARAEAAAAAGADKLCRVDLEAAEDALPSGASDPDLPYICLDAVHLSRWRGHTLARLGDLQAIETLEAALKTMSPDFQRATGGLHVDLAVAYASAGSGQDSRRHALAARSTIARTGSVRQRMRLAKVAA